MVKTVSLSKDFVDSKGERVNAVRNVSIYAKPGGVFGLLGVNGAGKTTMLRMLSTVIQPTGGSAEVAGFDVVREPVEVRRNIGFMSASTALYGRLTPNEILRYFGGLYGFEGAELEKRMAVVSDKLHLHDFANRLCDLLSTGQKQRVSIARTILHDPQVLFFDEPTAGLDVLSSQAVMEFIEESRDGGKCIVYCTHIMSEVERLCDEVAIIHEGSVRGAGSVAQLLKETNATSLEKAFLSLVGEHALVEA